MFSVATIALVMIISSRSERVRWDVVFSKLSVGRTNVEILQGDITELTSDAIVNAANSSLMGGGGVDGAIHRKGGPSILKECERIRSTLWNDGLPPGNAVITTAGSLKAKYVIHTVGPVWQGGRSGEPEILANCYTNCLRLATLEHLRSISFPAISTGAYGYPIELAAKVALDATCLFLSQNENSSLERVTFVLFSSRDLRTYETISSFRE